VRAGAGLLIHSPLMEQADQRAAQAREDEREADRARRERELREQEVAEQAAQDAFDGVQRHTVQEFLAQVDAADRRREQADQWRRDHGLPVADDPVAQPQLASAPWRPTRWELRRLKAEREAAAAATVATLADVTAVERKLSGEIVGVKAQVHAVSKRAEQDAGTSYRSSAPTQYTRYTPDGILGGPF
jgi:hypothetical protein